MFDQFDEQSSIQMSYKMPRSSSRIDTSGIFGEGDLGNVFNREHSLSHVQIGQTTIYILLAMFSTLHINWRRTDQTGRRWLHPETKLTQLKRCSAHKATPFPESPVSFFDRPIDLP